MDASEYRPISSTEKKKELKKGLPEKCKIVKFVPTQKKGARSKPVPRYQAYCGGKKIGPTRTPTKLKEAKKICNVWDGRRTGRIKNVDREEEFQRGAVRIRKEKLRQDMTDTTAYNPAEYDDPDISYSERMAERRARKTILGADPMELERYESQRWR